MGRGLPYDPWVETVSRTYIFLKSVFEASFWIHQVHKKHCQLQANLYETDTSYHKEPKMVSSQRSNDSYYGKQTQSKVNDHTNYP